MRAGAALGPLTAGPLSNLGWKYVFYALMTANALGLLVSWNDWLVSSEWHFKADGFFQSVVNCADADAAGNQRSEEVRGGTGGITTSINKSAEPIVIVPEQIVVCVVLCFSFGEIFLLFFLWLLRSRWVAGQRFEGKTRIWDDVGRFPGCRPLGRRSNIRAEINAKVPQKKEKLDLNFSRLPE